MLALAVVSGVLLLRFHWSIHHVLAATTAVAIVLHLVWS
jgi:hypothetical protein